MEGSLKNLIQRELSNQLGVKIQVIEDDITGDLKYSMRKRVVPRNAIGLNQIDLYDARQHSPSIQVGEVLELPYEPNDMVIEVVNSAISEYQRLEEESDKEEELRAELTVLGVTEGSLIFAEYVSSSMVGDCLFDYAGYQCIVSKSAQIPEDEFTLGIRYPMIVTSVQVSKDRVTLEGSRTTVSFTEELVRHSIRDLPQDIVIRKSARIPGVLSKVLVSSNSGRASALVIGKRGARAKEIQGYFGSERFQVVDYSDSSILQISNLLGDALRDIHYEFENPKCFNRFLRGKSRRAIVVCEDKSIGGIIGKSGSSLNLTNKLTKWSLQVVSESEYADRFQSEFSEYHPDFDWMGVDYPEYVLRFYGYCLHSLGMNSIYECKSLTKEDLSKVALLSDTDSEFILDLISDLEFLVYCPNCGEAISEHEQEFGCPYCGYRPDNLISES